VRAFGTQQLLDKTEAKKKQNLPACRWLKPVILATQEGKIRRITVQSQLVQFVRPYLKITLHQKGLVEWLKV
jgi:hypothetical protein